MPSHKILLSPGFHSGTDKKFNPERDASGRNFYIEGIGFGIVQSVAGVPEEDGTFTRFYDEEQDRLDDVSFPHIHYGEKVTDGLLDDERAQKIVEAAVERALWSMGPNI